VLESYHKFDYVSCKCGEIAITGGDVAFEVFANDFSNIIRIDDQGNEVAVKVEENGELADKALVNEASKVVSKKERVDSIISQLESLPSDAMSHPLTHYDLIYILRLIRENMT
jgi:hypothetical protein